MSGRMKDILQQSVRLNLILVVLAGVLPVLIVILISGWERREHEIDDSTLQMTQLADSIAGQQDKLVHGIHQWLSALAMLPEVRAMDAGKCTRLFQQFMKANPQHGGIVLIRPDGSVIASGTPFSPTANFSDMRHFRGALQNHEFSPGQFTMGRVSGLPVIPFAIPVTDAQGHIICVLSTSLRVETFADYFDLTSLPKDSLVGFVDANGIRMYRFPPMADYAHGEPISEHIWDSIRHVDKATTMTLTGGDGIMRIYAVRRLRLLSHQEPYVNVFVGTPRSYALAKADAITGRYLRWVAISLLLSLGLAWILGRYGIHKPVTRLAAVAQRLGSGDLSARSGLPRNRGSLGRLATALDDMATALETDMERRRRDKAAILEAKDRAEAANRTKNEFLATMSHEIRTPLNGIMGMLQLVLMDDPQESIRNYLETALQSCRNLLCILSDILDISRIEARALQLVPENFRLKDLFDPVIQLYGLEAVAKDLALACEVSPLLPEFVRGDPGRLRQVLYNLMGNALKFTEQGQVRLEAYPLPGAPEGMVRLHVAVIDTGIGIPEDKLGGVFDTFSQVDGSYARKYGGTGLGLAIAKNLITLMGGGLFVCSEFGVGTEVHITLPLAVAQGAPPKQPAYAPVDTASRPLTILLAEDDKVNRLTVGHMLTKMGHAVIEAGNGREALESLARNRVDGVLMDIQMPEMDGMEATRRIRAGEAGDRARRVPIVALTAHAMRDDQQLFLASGMDACIAKPVEAATLAEALARIAASPSESPKA